MRIALVSPYSWTYPGGVTRHIEALAESFIADGHQVRVLAPYDPVDLSSKVLHRGAAPQPLSPPDYLVSLGRTVGFKANGAVSNLSITPSGIAALQKELRTGGYDVVHIHEPVAPMIGWAAAELTRLPLVGTFHSYSERLVPNTIANFFGAWRVLNRLHVRIAVSEAAAWTGRRWFGGHYRVIPNGVHVDPDVLAGAGAAPLGDCLRIVFVGQSVERKGLPLLLRSFEALREHIPTELTVIGPSPEELAPMMLDDRGVRVLGKVDDARKREELQRADVLCAPSLRGESFGMVLTEAFAAGTPAVASDIAGYRDVVRDGVDGVLVPPADPQALAETLRDLWEEPERLTSMARAAAADVQRFAWSRVAAEVLGAYEDAIAVPAPQGAVQRAAVAVGVRSADLRPHARARRIPSLETRPVSRRVRVGSLLRRGALAAVSLGAILLAILALKKIGLANVASALVASSPSFVILGLGVMCGAMALRAVSWHAILRAALPQARVRMSDAMQGTFIGVLMSSTLPARLGEPSRALVVARRAGRPREYLPVVLGTVVSQTLLNIVALMILGAVMFSSVNIFSGHQDALLVAAITPLALLVIVLLAPLVLRHQAGRARFHRLQSLLAQARGAMTRVRAGLVVFRRPRLGVIATAAQLGAWAMQWVSCYILLVALGLSHQAGMAAAAAVLFAVNISAVLPATPANLGVFQAACAAVLHTGWHVGFGTGVAYGVILQAVEVTTAILMGGPALLKEGMSWREVRLRAMHATPVKLPARSPRAVRRGGPVDVRG
ncbi:MAG TPA: lysylphosphatidylglycerol synthase domain-containing protein [Solirubrobacteraceae bacterium]|jgi:phosphatidylinositol alpha-mannosyltransferase|nr:lysylphosphatidylglycerol synthase domain-containing protein [Solirubrobacteraceae bacterium]